MSDWKLMAKYLAGECTVPEVAEFEAWLNASDENKAQFEAQKLLWEESAVEEEVIVDVEAGLNRVHQSMASSENSRSRSLGWLKYAAVLAVIATGAWVWLSLPGNSESRIINATRQALAVDLPDGSKVWLNRKAEITFDKEMNEDLREVTLVGEAYFDVAKQPHRPFLVHTQEATIRVLGTEFNVDGSNLARVTVDVFEGSVALYGTEKEDERVTLEAYEVGTFTKESGRLAKTSLTDQNSIAWKTGVLRFEEERLSKVILYLEEYYDVEIAMEDALDGCRIFTVLDNLSLEQALEILELTLGIDVKREGDSISLSGSCK